MSGMVGVLQLNLGRRVTWMAATGCPPETGHDSSIEMLYNENNVLRLLYTVVLIRCNVLFPAQTRTDDTKNSPGMNQADSF